MLIQEMAQYLQVNGIGTLGTDIFLGLEPDSPNVCTTLFDTGGYSAETALEDLKRTIQIRVRDPIFQNGHARIWQIYNLLDRPGDRMITTSSNRKLVAQAMQPPSFLERDTNNRFIFVFNLAAWTSRD